MWLCGLFRFVVFVCLALWRSLKKLSSAPAPRSWQTLLSWVGEGPTAAGHLTSSLRLWKHLVTKDLLDPSLPSSNPICLSKSRSLSVCVGGETKSSDTENVFCAVKVELLFWTSEHSLGEETEIAQVNHFTGETGRKKIQILSRGAHPVRSWASKCATILQRARILTHSFTLRSC